MLVVPVSRQANRPTLNTLWGVRHELVSIRPTGVTYCSDTTGEFSGVSGLSGYLARTSIWSPTRSPARACHLAKPAATWSARAGI